MKKDYNFKVCENIELILSNGNNVIMPLYQIEKIEIKLRKLRWKNSVYMPGFQKENSNSFYE